MSKQFPCVFRDACLETKISVLCVFAQKRFLRSQSVIIHVARRFFVEVYEQGPK